MHHFWQRTTQSKRHCGCRCLFLLVEDTLVAVLFWQTGQAINVQVNLFVGREERSGVRDFENILLARAEYLVG